MIADWTVELGRDAPSIDVPWEGWVDLRWEPENPLRPWHAQLAARLPEAQAYPELVDLLRRANSGPSLSSKVDIFPVTRDEVDPEIAEAGEEATRCGLGSYIDLLPEPPRLVPGFEQFERVARHAATELGKIETLGICCVEIVVRPALCFDQPGYGWTVYAMAFGPTQPAARQTWAAAAMVAVVQMQRSMQALDRLESAPGRG